MNLSHKVRQLTYARLDFENENPLFKKIYALVSLQNTEKGRNSRKNGSTVLRKENDQVRSLGVSFNVLSVLTEGWSANSGFEIYDDFVKSTRVDIEQKTGVSTKKRGFIPMIPK